ncbi:IS3 family transposase [Azospirillum lipoferum]|uniref:IS3 family transposase n=1 Tax=Azospirillum lipoferum TaxID=193 RepID=A0A5A9FWD2_AZOLI|nr:IS3 family transposase [Azospirillum lipoferum]
MLRGGEKVESVHRTRFEPRDQARREVFAYIETYYNRQRADRIHHP